MKKYIMKPHGPLITNEQVAKDIYQKIVEMNPLTENVTIDMRGIITMTTQCAKAIFGQLYKDLGYSLYYQNITIVNKSDTISKIIKMSIEDCK